MMKSVRLQLLVTLAAVATVVGVFVFIGPPPTKSIWQAAADGDRWQVERNLTWGADVNEPWGLAYGRLWVTMPRTLKGRVEFDGCTPRVMTPLYLAVAAGHEDVVQLLLERGAKVNAGQPFGWSLGTPGWSLVSVAMMNGHMQIAALLRRHGARE